MAAVPKAGYTIESAWGQDASGLFRFGISPFGSSTDLFAASSWSATFNGTYDQLSKYGRTMTITRGRDSDMTTFRAGQLDLGMRDANGLYNPYNSSSPLVASGSLDTDKPVRVSATLDGIVYPLYYGFGTDIVGDPTGHGMVQITALDFLDKLDRQSPQPPWPTRWEYVGGVLTAFPDTPVPGMSTGQLVGILLDWYGWTDPTLRILAAGDTINSTYTRADGSQTGLALMEELLEAERGIVYVNAAGAVVYADRHTRYATTSAGTIDRTLNAFEVGRSNQNIVNSWTVQRTAMDGTTIGAPQTATSSSRQHGTISKTITTPFLNNDNQALNLAQYLLLRTQTTETLVYDVPLTIPDKPTLIQALSRDIGDRVTLTIQPRNMPQITGDFYIEAVTHTIQTQGSPRHATTWRVSKVPSYLPFRFGVSQFGGTDVFTY